MNTRYIDTHAHLNLSAFADDVDVVAAQCLTADVAVINIGTKQLTSARAVELAAQYDHMYAMVGLHPIQVCGTHLNPPREETVPLLHDEDEIGGAAFTSKGEVFDTDFYRDLALHTKVVGIGECGFDYYHTDPTTYAVQEAAFIAQIQLANQLGLPLMIHTRGPKAGESSPTGRSVYTDVYEVLRQYARVPFNVHFYAGSYEEAKAFFEIGGTISFTGVITFAKVYEDIVRAVPLDLIHAETDCPYVAPVPYRGKRCQPTMVIEVYKKIAELRREDEEKVRETLRLNALRLYGV